MRLWEMLRYRDVDNTLKVRVQASHRTLLLFANWIYSGKVTFLVFGGASEIDAVIACWHKSSFFTATCEQAMENARQGESDFCTRLNYLAKTKGGDVCPQNRNYHQGTPQCHIEWLIDLCTFAVRYDISLLYEDALHALSVAIRVSNELPGWKLVNKTYNEVSESSPLCLFLLKLYAGNWSPSLATDLSSRNDFQLHHRFESNLMCELSLAIEDAQKALEKTEETRGKEREQLERTNDKQFVDHIFQKCQLEWRVADLQAELVGARVKIRELEQEKSVGGGITSLREHDDGEDLLTGLLRTSSFFSKASSEILD